MQFKVRDFLLSFRTKSLASSLLSKKCKDQDTQNWRNLKERDQLEDLDINEMIILKWILKKFYGGTWTGFLWLRIGTGARLLSVW